MKTIDPLELQRLVDGELDFEQTQQLLKLAESDPKSWRLIASSFIENQMWQSEFADDASVGEALAVNHFEQGKSFGSGYVKWFSLAAMVLLAASVAFLLDDSESGLVNSGLVNSGAGMGGLPVDVADNGQPLPDTSSFPRFDNTGDNLNQMPAMYQVQMEGPDGNTYVDSQVPLYTTDLGDARKWLGREEVPEKMRRKLADSGYGVVHDVRYLRGQLNDGRSFLIPVRNYRFSPGQ